ncbi:MAG: hypothetical protein DHS20C10_03180 [marine bacterium B5-7]|nr:MAG: hypothetical protein DHS20C10_03180 [marine bacterium B5-7]
MLATHLIEEYLQTCAYKFSDLQRLGFVLEYIHVDFELTPLERRIADASPKYTLLVPDKIKKIKEKNKRWRILVNEYIQLDDI